MKATYLFYSHSDQQGCQSYSSLEALVLTKF